MSEEKICPLPPELVSLLELRHESQKSLSPQAQRDWNRFFAATAQNIKVLQQFASHPRLEELSLSADTQLKSLQVCLDNKSDRLEPEAYNLHLTIQTYSEIREQLRVSKFSEFDNLVHGLSAFLRNNLHRNSLAVLMEKAQDRCDALSELYEAVEADLPEEIRLALLEGFDNLREGFGLLASGDLENWKRAQPNFRDGAKILEHLQQWEQDYEDSCRSPVPVIGETVLDLLDSLEQEGEISPSLLEKWESELSKLLTFWHSSKGESLLPADRRTQLIHRVDALLSLGASLGSATPEEQLMLLQELESTFLEIQESSIDLEKLRRTKAGWLVDLLTGALQGGIPRHHILGTAEGFAGTGYQVIGAFMHQYLQTSDRSQLYEAISLLETLLEQNEPPEFLF